MQWKRAYNVLNRLPVYQDSMHRTSAINCYTLLSKRCVGANLRHWLSNSQFFAEGWLYVHCNQNIPMAPSSVPNHGAMSVARNSFYCMEGSFMEFNVLIINMHNSWDVIKMWSEDSKFSKGLNVAMWSEQIIGVTCSLASNLWHHPLAEPDNELSGIFVNFSQIRWCGYWLGSGTMKIINLILTWIFCNKTVPALGQNRLMWFDVPILWLFYSKYSCWD